MDEKNRMEEFSVEENEVSKEEVVDEMIDRKAIELKIRSGIRAGLSFSERPLPTCGDYNY